MPFLLLRRWPLRRDDLVAAIDEHHGPVAKLVIQLEREWLLLLLLLFFLLAVILQSAEQICLTPMSGRVLPTVVVVSWEIFLSCRQRKDSLVPLEAFTAQLSCSVEPRRVQRIGLEAVHVVLVDPAGPLIWRMEINEDQHLTKLRVLFLRLRYHFLWVIIARQWRLLLLHLV